MTESDPKMNQSFIAKQLALGNIDPVDMLASAVMDKADYKIAGKFKITKDEINHWVTTNDRAAVKERLFSYFYRSEFASKAQLEKLFEHYCSYQDEHERTGNPHNQVLKKSLSEFNKEVNKFDKSLFLMST